MDSLFQENRNKPTHQFCKFGSGSISRVLKELIYWNREKSNQNIYGNQPAFYKYVQTIFKKNPSSPKHANSAPLQTMVGWRCLGTRDNMMPPPMGPLSHPRAEEGQGQPSPACCPHEVCEGGHGCRSRAKPFLWSPQQQQQPRFLRIGVGQVCHSHPVVQRSLRPHTSASSASSKSWHSIETAPGAAAGAGSAPPPTAIRGIWFPSLFLLRSTKWALCANTVAMQTR